MSRAALLNHVKEGTKHNPQILREITSMRLMDVPRAILRVRARRGELKYCMVQRQDNAAHSAAVSADQIIPILSDLLPHLI